MNRIVTIYRMKILLNMKLGGSVIVVFSVHTAALIYFATIAVLQYLTGKKFHDVKVLLFRRRRMEEVQKHEKLPKHCNCVRFFRAWEERQHLYLLTEVCRSSLADVANDKHDLPESTIWEYLVDLLQVSLIFCFPWAGFSV